MVVVRDKISLEENVWDKPKHTNKGKHTGSQCIGLHLFYPSFLNIKLTESNRFDSELPNLSIISMQLV
jgi:hypothetical protein